MNFGIKKSFLIISALILAFNMFVAIHTFVPQAGDSSFRWVIHFLFPLGVAMLGGSLLGFVVMMFPSKNSKLPQEVKYVRSKIIGILIVNGILFFGYIYKLIYFYTING